MAVFTYQGTGATGERISGEVEAATRAEALRRLTRDRIQPLSLQTLGPETTLKGNAGVATRQEAPRGG